ncbi:MAG: hypothetical protein RLO18_18485 [Gimesia chilikensis]
MKENAMTQSDDYQNEADREEMGYHLMFQQMYPQVRNCDPRAYFRAKLTNHRKALEVLLTEEEYLEECQRIFKEIIDPDKRDLIMNLILLFFIFAGVTGIAYGFYTQNWGFICLVPSTLVSLWFLRGQRRYYYWLNSLTFHQRAEFIDYLRSSHLIDDTEQNQMRSRLESRQ